MKRSVVHPMGMQGIILAVVAGVSAGASAQTTPVGSAFTYQGVLRDQGAPANGSFELEFRLFDADTGGMQIGDAVTTAVLVSDGLFDVDLDFGPDVFGGEARWLEISVRATGGSLVLLSPRRKINPAPIAIHSATAEVALTAESAMDADRLNGLSAAEIVASATGSVEHFVRQFAVGRGENIAAGQAVSFIPDGAEIRAGFAAAGNGPKATFSTAGQAAVFRVTALSRSSFIVGFIEPLQTPLGMAVVGVVAGNSITFGTPTVISDSNTGSIDFAALTSDTVVISFTQSGQATARVGQVSGVTLTLGPQFVLNPTATSEAAVTRLSSNRFVAAYGDLLSGNNGKAKVGEISGTSITFGPPVTFNPSFTESLRAATLPPDRVIMAYRGTDSFGLAAVGLVSGMTLSFGAEVIFADTNLASVGIGLAALPPDDFVVAWDPVSVGPRGIARAGRAIGNAITFGDKVDYQNNDVGTIDVVRMRGNEFIIGYTDQGSGGAAGAVRRGRLEGTSLILAGDVVYNAGLSFSTHVAALDESTIVGAFRDIDGLDIFGSAVVSRLEPTPILGIARESGSSGQSIPVTLLVDRGLSDVHSGLTPGKVYFAQPSGDITVDESGVRIGLAVSATEILLMP